MSCYGCGWQCCGDGAPGAGEPAERGGGAAERRGAPGRGELVRVRAELQGSGGLEEPVVL